MANYYEFEGMERKLANIKERWETFGKTVRSALEPISAARFNEREYGERATEEKITGIIRRAKRRFSDKCAAYTSGVHRAVYDSAVRIDGEAKIAAQTAKRLNRSLAQWTSLNEAFARGEYRRVTENAGRMDTTGFDEEVKRLWLLLQAEAHDALCAAELSDASWPVYEDCEKYYRFCKENGAERHLPSAACGLLSVCSRLATVPEMDAWQVYRACRSGIEAYADLDESGKTGFAQNYQTCLSEGTRRFNLLSEAAYTSFDYPTVKSLLNDAALFPESDIDNAFFRKGTADAAALFAYARAYGKPMTDDVAEMVFTDTESLLRGDRRDVFISYWLTRYDDFGMKYIDRIIRETDWDVCFPALIRALTEHRDSIQKRADCFSDLARAYETVLSGHRNAIRLYAFLTNAVLFHQCIRDLEVDAGTDADVFREGVRIIDNITYPMIHRYRKRCGGYGETMVDALNEVMDAASMRLFRKRYLKNLRPAGKEESEDTVVALCTAKTRAAGRKMICLAVAVAAVVLILLFLILYVKK